MLSLCCSAVSLTQSAISLRPVTLNNVYHGTSLFYDIICTLVVFKSLCNEKRWWCNEWWSWLVCTFVEATVNTPGKCCSFRLNVFFSWHACCAVFNTRYEHTDTRVTWHTHTHTGHMTLWPCSSGSQQSAQTKTHARVHGLLMDGDLTLWLKQWKPLMAPIKAIYWNWWQ